METNSIAETARVVGRSQSVVHLVIQRYNKENSLSNKTRSGRPPKTDKRDDRTIVQMSMKDRFLSSRKVASQFNAANNKQVLYKTVIRRLMQQN